MKKKKFTKHHPEFWVKKGFSEEDSIIKSKEYSIWFKENSIRPLSLKYWMKLDFTEEEAKIKKDEYKLTRPKRFNRYSIEDQMLKFNLSEIEAAEKVKSIRENMFNNYCVEHQMKRYNLSKVEAIEKIERIKISNNSWTGKTEEEIKFIKGKISNSVQHSFSKMSEFDFNSMSYHNKEFWIKKGFSEEESMAKAYETIERNREKLRVYRKDDPNFMKGKSSCSLEYWINKGFSEEDATVKLKERQSTFTLEKCVEKHGDVEGRKRFDERQKNWSIKIEKMYKEGKFTKFCSTNYSNIERELWKSIIIKMNLNDNEYNSCTNNKVFFRHFPEIKRTFSYDFRYKNKIIEFNGVLWHCKPSLWKDDEICHIRNITAKEIWEKDKLKIESIQNKGWEVLIVWEDEYKKDKKTIVQKCIDFLTK